MENSVVLICSKEEDHGIGRLSEILRGDASCPEGGDLTDPAAASSYPRAKQCHLELPAPARQQQHPGAIIQDLEFGTFLKKAPQRQNLGLWD